MFLFREKSQQMVITPKIKKENNADYEMDMKNVSKNCAETAKRSPPHAIPLFVV